MHLVLDTLDLWTLYAYSTVWAAAAFSMASLHTPSASQQTEAQGLCMHKQPSPTPADRQVQVLPVKHFHIHTCGMHLLGAVASSCRWMCEHAPYPTPAFLDAPIRTYRNTGRISDRPWIIPGKPRVPLEDTQERVMPIPTGRKNAAPKGAEHVSCARHAVSGD